MKIMLFQTKDGHWFRVYPDGSMIQDERWQAGARPSGAWRFLGTNSRHWHQRITAMFNAGCKDHMDHPERFIGGYVWDLDHGTTRRWNRRIVFAYVREVPA